MSEKDWAEHASETSEPVVITTQGPIPFSLLPQLFREEKAEDNGVLRSFATGATRDTTENKPEPWGFTSALVMKRFCEYMQAHRIQADGKLRDSDNWKKGIPREVYQHSLSRHVEDLRLILEGFPGQAGEPDLETVLCAILFNVQGMLHEVIRDRL